MRINGKKIHGLQSLADLFVKKPAKDTPEAKEARLQLYMDRFDNGLDLYTGQPRDETVTELAIE